MATSSITKEFFVKDDTAFEKLKKNWTRSLLCVNKWLNLHL